MLQAGTEALASFADVTKAAIRAGDEVDYVTRVAGDMMQDGVLVSAVCVGY